MKMFLVGGFIRDSLLGYESKDIDFCCLATSYEQLGQYLIDSGFTIKHKYEDKLTYRAIAPNSQLVQDYVFCRGKEVYEDGKLISVSPGTLEEDLARRDYTINAIAQNVKTGEFIDPFGGREDCERRILRAVGNAKERFLEDPRRILRGIRFAAKYDLVIDSEVDDSFRHLSVVENLLDPKYKDSLREEINKSFKANTLGTLSFLDSYSLIKKVLFSPKAHNLHLLANSKES